MRDEELKWIYTRDNLLSQVENLKKELEVENTVPKINDKIEIWSPILERYRVGTVIKWYDKYIMVKYDHSGLIECFQKFDFYSSGDVDLENYEECEKVRWQLI